MLQARVTRHQKTCEHRCLQAATLAWATLAWATLALGQVGHNSAVCQHKQLPQMRHMDAMTSFDPRHSLHPWPQTTLAMGSATVVQVYCLPWCLLHFCVVQRLWHEGVMGLGVVFAAKQRLFIEGLQIHSDVALAQAALG